MDNANPEQPLGPDAYWHSVNCQWAGVVQKVDTQGIADGPWADRKGKVVAL